MPETLRQVDVRMVGCHFGSHTSFIASLCMAGTTGLEPATSAVTGQRSNQLSYVPRHSFDIELISIRNRRSAAFA
jgi:hypothetical protein